MKITSPILGTMSGKLGGAVGANSRGGVQYLRKLVKPGNPRTVAQTTIRLILTSISAAWRSVLTDLQRAGWEGISPASSSGIDSYLKGNAAAVQGGQARTDDAPDSLALVTDPVASVTYVASTHLITATGVATANVMWNALASAAQASSRLAQQHPVQFVQQKAAAVTQTFTVPVGHPARNVVAGDIVYIEIQQTGKATTATAGQVSTPQLFRVVVT